MSGSLRKCVPVFIRPSRFLSTGLHNGVPLRSQKDLDKNDANTGCEITFNDCRLAYRSKTTWEVIRSLFVLGFCKREILVDHSEKFVRLGRAILGRKLFNKLMKTTFFAQFVAGENDKEIMPLIQRLRNFGVSVILNYAVEDDEQGGDQEKSGLIDHKHGTRVDPREQNMYSFMKTIDHVAAATNGVGFCAIKVTALSRPETLMAVTDIIQKSQSFANQLLGEPSEQRPVIGRGISLSDLDKLLQKTAGKQSLVKRWLEIAEIDNKNRLVDTIQWSKVFDGAFNLDDISTLPHLVTKNASPSEKEELSNLTRRMEAIAKHAHGTNMRVLVDAEQSYFQPAIARLALELMRRYNKDRPSFYNTYQCYLKNAYDDVEAHLSLAGQENFMFGAKVVRGAYIVLERQRASDLDYSDLINPTFDATTAMYKKVVGHIMDDMERRGAMSHMVIAGHNEETVKWAVNQLDMRPIPRKSRQIYFGQLLGMCDQLSFTLADAGYNVVKCVPYGTVDEVLPYLIRRAHENRGVMDKTDKERSLLWQELVRRVKGGDLRHCPDISPTQK